MKFVSMLNGQYIPVDNKLNIKLGIVLIGEKPSDYFLKHPEMKHFGNYNNPLSLSDMRLQTYIRKYLGKVYITDMVKTQGKSGADFESEWQTEPIHRKYLSEELQRIKPKKIGALGRKVEELLNSEFPEYKNKIVYLVHPSATRYPRNLVRWDEQFKQLLRSK